MRIQHDGNVGIGTSSPGSKLTVQGSTAGATVLDIQGTSGQLFSVTDDLTGTLFAVSDISGIPILSVDASGVVNVDDTLTVSNNLSVGNNHTNTGCSSTIASGNSNTNTGNCSFIGGGSNNSIFTFNSSAIIGGSCNTISGVNSAIIGIGDSNLICSSANSGIFSGNSNTICNGASHIIGGGFNNTINTGVFSIGNTISGGSGNRICDAVGITAQCNTIAGGECNSILGSTNGFIGGNYNTICHTFSSAVGIGRTSSATCTLYVNALSKTSGTFSIPHPDPSKTSAYNLNHSFVESPTAGDNIYRFKVNVVNGVGIIELPSYYKFLNGNDQVFVNPKGHFGIAYGEVNEAQTQIQITANADGEYNVLLIGTRKDELGVKGWNGVETFK
jgi:hypothetical protein